MVLSVPSFSSSPVDVRWFLIATFHCIDHSMKFDVAANRQKERYLSEQVQYWYAGGRAHTAERSECYEHCSVGQCENQATGTRSRRYPTTAVLWSADSLALGAPPLYVLGGTPHFFMLVRSHEYPPMV